MEVCARWWPLQVDERQLLIQLGGVAMDVVQLSLDGGEEPARLILFLPECIPLRS